MAVIHRLLVVLIWGCMFVVGLFVYRQAVNESRYWGLETDTMSALMSDYMQWDGLGTFIFIALVVNLLVNWIITGDIFNFAGLNKKKSKDNE